MDGTEKMLQIGEIARLTGFPAKTLRYYEERGLVQPAARTEDGYRLYGTEEVAPLEFVKRAKLLGLSLDGITGLVGPAAEGGRGKVIPRLGGVLEGHLRETERKMAEQPKRPHNKGPPTPPIQRHTRTPPECGKWLELSGSLLAQPYI